MSACISRRGALYRLGALGAAALAPVATLAAEGWPSQPIRLIVTQGAGSGSDVVARLLASRMQILLANPVVVENRPGAAGTIGHEFVARSAPDGYTLLLSSTGPLLVTPVMLSTARFRYTDFVPVAAVNSASFLVLVAKFPGAPTTLTELLDRVRGSDASFGSSGAGTMAHLASALILRKAGLRAQHVQYRANTQVLQDLVSGQLLFACDSATSAMSLIESGRLRALAVTGGERMSALPEVPTLAEAGLPGVEATTIGGLLAPKGTPDVIVERLSATVAQALSTPEVRDRMATLGSPAMIQSSVQYRAQLRKDAPFWESLVRELGLSNQG